MSEARIDRLEARLAHIERTIIRIEQQRAVTKAKIRRQTEAALQLGCQGGYGRGLYRRTRRGRYGCRGIDTSSAPLSD
jgi:hypothetical protein